MERATPSARDIAAKILGRSGLVTSKRNTKESVATPAEDATPRTLIGGILDAASISKSGHVAPQTRKRSKLTKSPAIGLPAKRKKGIRQSLGDNATPRTIIKNFLMEASPETPLEVPLKLPEKIFQAESSASDSSYQSLPGDTPAPASLSEPVSEIEIHNNEMDSLPKAQDRKHALAGEVKDGNNAFSREDIVNKDNEDAKVLSPAQVIAEVDIPEISPKPANETSTTTTDEQESVADIMSSVDTSSVPPGKRASPQPANETSTTTTTDEQESQSDSIPEADIMSSVDTSSVPPGKRASPQPANETSTTTTTDEQESQSDSIPEADIMSSVDTSSVPQGKRIWKELKTPNQQPVRRGYVLSEKQMVPEEKEEEEEEDIRASKAFKKPPAATKRTKTKSTHSGDTNLPSGLVKSIFQHFSKSRISRDALNSIEKGSSVFFKQISSDLMAYSKHAGRTTIENGDVELLMKRQGFINDKQSLNSLIEKYLPLEYRQELIPVVQSGNEVVLKKSD